MSLEADWVGGVQATVVPYLALTGSASGGASAGGQGQGASAGYGCNAALGFGVNVGVGTQIELEDPVTGKALDCAFCKKEMPPHQVYSTGTQQLWSGACPQ